MTRGTFVYVGEEGCYTSTEFNGDMYLDGSGHGEDAVKALTHVTNKDDFIDQVIFFNERHHNYPHYEVREVHYADKDWLKNMSKDYFDRWFSDYLYMKNCSNETIEMLDRDKETIMFEPNTIVVLNFGRNYVSFDNEGEIKKASDDYLRANHHS